MEKEIMISIPKVIFLSLQVNQQNADKGVGAPSLFPEQVDNSNGSMIASIVTKWSL
jgi:hypothetical protein